MKLFRQRLRNRRNLVRLFALFGATVAVGLAWILSDSGAQPTGPETMDATAAATMPVAASVQPPPQHAAPQPDTDALASPGDQPAHKDKQPTSHTQRYTVARGDTLEGIFAKLQLPIGELYEILQADEPYLILDVLKPGDQLTFRTDDSHELQALSLIVDPSKTVTYRLTDDGGFEYHETLAPTTWITDVVRGEVHGSFYVSAHKAGLSDKMAMTVYQLLKNRLNFRRDLRAGDRFGVVIERETIDGKPTGNNHLQAVRIESRRLEYGAYLSSDGSYYDAEGGNLTPALLRYPTRKRFRISSPFSPRRLNPVTGRYAPHNGVDFAMPAGTPVRAAGDGRVTRVASQRYAGKYLEIDEFGPYSSRYLHLSKILVHKGQHVQRGQVVALSGNTGRSTGPHLHYELHIKGKPVNPITAKIPELKSVSKQQLIAYRKRVKSLQDLMDGDVEIAGANGREQPSQQQGESFKTAASDLGTPADGARLSPETRPPST